MWRKLRIRVIYCTTLNMEHTISVFGKHMTLYYDLKCLPK